MQKSARSSHWFVSRLISGTLACHIPRLYLALRLGVGGGFQSCRSCVVCLCAAKICSAFLKVFNAIWRHWVVSNLWAWMKGHFHLHHGLIPAVIGQRVCMCVVPYFHIDVGKIQAF